jgi:hypothetical protein
MTSSLAEATVGETAERFEAELRSFFALCILNLVFGALILAFGVQFIVTSVLALVNGGASPWFAAAQVLAWGAIAVIGLRWILSSVEVMSGVTALRDEYRALERPVPKEALTGLIVRMMVQYREHKKAVRLMTVVCTLGGAIFLALGAMNLVEAGMAAGSGESLYLSLLAAGVNLAIGIVALRLSSWFRRYARAWDLRLAEASRSEEPLRQTMERG